MASQNASADQIGVALCLPSRRPLELEAAPHYTLTLRCVVDAEEDREDG